MTATKLGYKSDRGPWVSDLFAAKGSDSITVGLRIYEESAPTIPLRVRAQITEVKKVEVSGIDNTFGCRAIFTFPDGHTESVHGEYKPLTEQGIWFTLT